MFKTVRNSLALATLAFGLLAPATFPSASAQAATLKAVIDLSQQRMNVYVNGKRRYRWAVSTGTRKWPTRTGSFTPFGVERIHKSKRWNMTLTHVVKFDQTNEGINAIHGTHAVGRLGRQASHGCVRLAPRNAAIFYRLVGKHGLWGTQVVVKR